MPGPDLLILDCDGVLVDSELASLAVLTGLLAEQGVEIGIAEGVARFVGHSFPSVRGMIRDREGVDLPDTFEAAYRTRLLDAFATGLRPVPGAARMLATLGAPCCVATSSSPERAARSLALCGLDRYVEGRVFTASEVPRGKPAPDLFLHAARRMGAEPARCLVVEDSLPGLAAARDAGMAALRFVGGAHLAGSHAGGATPAGIASFDRWDDFQNVVATEWRPPCPPGEGGIR